MAAHFASPSFTSQDVGFRSCNLVLSIRDNRLCWNGHVGNLRRARTAVVAPLRMALCKVAGFGPNRTSSSFVAVGKTGFNEDRVEFARAASLMDNKLRGCDRRRTRRLSGLSPVADAARIFAFAVEWQPAVEQLMFVTSVALVYLAGIVTPRKTALIERTVDVSLPRTGPSLDEGAAVSQQFKREYEFEESESEVQERDSWGKVQAKFGAALTRLARKEKDVGSFESRDRAVRNPVLNLQALESGSRLRLLVLALEQLRTEVDSINVSSKLLPAAEWSKLALDVLCGLVEPICKTWLAQEPRLVGVNQQSPAQMVDNGIFTVEEPTKVSGGLTGAVDPSPTQNADSISQGKALVLDYLQRTGKTDLYIDLLFFLRFQTMRPGSCCDCMVMSRHVGNALEDLVVALADGAAAIYLGRDPQMGGRDSDWPILVRPSIKSTRALERFRNEIALRGWFQRNFTSVAAMFEDRFELWTIDTLRDSEVATPIESQQTTKDDGVTEIRLKPIELPARRSKELRALTGWRYVYSLYLELSDIVGPLLQVLGKKLGGAVSFLLVRLIGRSLGLIFEGIRQSVRWASK
ncbi:uncharacterized protein [Physcomitrium patens]|uniref:DUF3685 domain-containing protein n=2 Tax=Physcomitrium patens TaxID=3218 RepID=A0A2K1IFH0_PHYPA|nr:uncharacterized protein LOC112276951 isoform X1 [Physcomitrium patens]PNR28014.1 hypothetical protein PHYPA_028606 [Physcomitrium patens]|eukprot:XP_024364560.1 uncharacterized protein LOC112276951 isoform X1 [Physcomitrella patens]